MYVAEILRNEGLNAFTTLDVAFVSPAVLASSTSSCSATRRSAPAQVTSLTGWVNGGGTSSRCARTSSSPGCSG